MHAQEQGMVDVKYLVLMDGTVGSCQVETSSGFLGWTMPPVPWLDGGNSNSHPELGSPWPNISRRKWCSS